MTDLARRFLEKGNWDPQHDRKRITTYEPYFLGPYVYHEDEGITYLVDGQQRITTLHLLLMHLAVLLRDQDQEGQARRIDPLVAVERHGERAYALDIDGREGLYNAIESGTPFEPSERATQSMRLLADCVRTLDEEFPENLRDEALPYFVDWLLERVALIGIKAPSRQQSWEIFEGMNNRGLRPGPNDLLKSHLIGKLDGESNGADAGWRTMVNELAGVEANLPGEFFNHYLLAQHVDLPPSDSDLEKVATRFHVWVREHSDKLGLTNSTKVRSFINSLQEYAGHYAMLASAARDYHAELPHLWFNHRNGIGNQYVPILAAIEHGDDRRAVKAKSSLVAAYLDQVYARRIVNSEGTQPGSLDDEALRIAAMVRGSKTLERLREILAGEAAALENDFAGMMDKSFGLRPTNKSQVRYLLARLTAFVEVGCGRTDNIAKYLDDQRPFEIEHIWANHFERYQPEAKREVEFQALRNRLGALLLLPKSDNASYQDDPYETKVEYYARQNQLAASLHERSREKNPGLNGFIKKHRLEKEFRHYKKFDRSAIDDRQLLYKKLCDLVWSPIVFGAKASETSAARPVHTARARTRARYDVEPIALVAAGLVPPKARLIGRRRGREYRAQIMEDGQIRIDETGELFSSLSGAGQFVLNTKSCQGWTFWLAETPSGERRLADLRNEGLEKGLLDKPWVQSAFDLGIATS